jgi:hypothetical protein
MWGGSIKKEGLIIMSKLLVAMLLALGSASASAGWVYGDNYFYVVDPTLPVTISFHSSSAADNLTVFVASKDDTGAISDWQKVFVKTGNSDGSYCIGCGYSINTINFSYLPTGSEIVFRLDDLSSGKTYYSAASDNADDYAHTRVLYNYHDDATLAFVSFEDQWRGGDKDYDDISFLVTNVSNIPTPVPEPETYAMMLAGLGVMTAVARRRRRKQA